MSNVAIRFSGFGGQGIVLSAIVVAHAAVLYDGKEAVQTQSYGPESRGGASKAEVIIGDRRIDYPLIERSDVLLALSQESLGKYFPEAGSGSWVIIDPALVQSLPEAENVRLVQLPATEMADELGSRLAANMITLGALIGLTSVVSDTALEKSIMDNTNESYHQLNISGMQAGLKYVRERY